MTPLSQRIVDVLSGRRVTPTADLHAAVYGLREDGGPSDGALRTAVHRTNKRLRGDLRIVRLGRKGWALTA